jgi:hypothetical protein
MVSHSKSLVARVEKLDAERQKHRKAFFKKKKAAMEGRARKSGAYMLGRSESNGRVKTMRTNKLRMSVDKWHVVLRFTRKDSSHLKDKDLEEVERRIKEGKEKKKTVVTSTHIIPAVRMLKHVREGYIAELATTRQTLRDFAGNILFLADLGKAVADEHIQQVVSFCQRFHEYGLKGKQLPVKKRAAKERLEDSITMLKAVQELPQNQRGFAIGQPCAKLVSVVNRLGRWRDEAIIGQYVYNEAREASLRMSRDAWLLSQLVRFAEIPETVAGYEIIDREKAGIVEKVKEMIARGVAKEEILAFIKEHNKRFRVKERVREGAERQIALMEAGIMPKGGEPKKDYLIGHYGWLYRFVNMEETRKALDKADYLILFTEANKPGFVLRELSKSPDSYMEPVLERFADAVAEYDRKAFDAASKHFAAAAKALKAKIKR